TSTRKLGGQDGFTLLEVLISFALLLFITLIVYQKIGQSYKLRDKFVNEGDFHNSIAAAVDILNRDITMIYSPVIMVPRQAANNNLPPDPELQKAIAEGDQKRGSEYWLGVIDVSGIRASRFEGTETSLKFLSASHVRVYRETRESMIVKVAYSIEDTGGGKGNLEGTRTLVKRMNTNAFDVEDDEGEYVHVYRLLPGIKSLAFRYYERSRDRWFGKWDSETQDFKFKFPDVIELTMEVAGEGNQTFDGSYLFRPEIPIYGIYPTL
ncbi:MAG TPA: prepilin-type N-terminal cleavage/methylation domain-containing protein, partial [Bdellovibrionota bacterium]|nr:prepilin-type N-terminal cleavage/methylation domain-containing protein [Bdellovibrionota bacterium]